MGFVGLCMGFQASSEGVLSVGECLEQAPETGNVLAAISKAAEPRISKGATAPHLHEQQRVCQVAQPIGMTQRKQGHALQPRGRAWQGRGQDAREERGLAHTRHQRAGRWLAACGRKERGRARGVVSARSLTVLGAGPRLALQPSRLCLHAQRAAAPPTRGHCIVQHGANQPHHLHHALHARDSLVH